MKCTACKTGTYEKRRVPYDFLGERIGTFDALVCSKCEETLFESHSSDEIEVEVKRRGLWGLRARTKIAQAGNALDVRIPKNLVKFLSLKKGQDVVIEPIDKTRLQIVVN